MLSLRISLISRILVFRIRCGAPQSLSAIAVRVATSIGWSLSSVWRQKFWVQFTLAGTQDISDV